ncbi:MAG: hypothetical protein LBR80_12405 [Deltaproteobacteria bacterium]|nr:hypothetical protein [Deltaproteobacteria bacterium]
MKRSFCTFADLDGTLFQTLPKCGPVPVDRLVPAAAGRDGRDLSYMTPGQVVLFRLLKAAGALVPVTARNLESFSRVKLPFTDGAILDFGGVILDPDGVPDPEWSARIAPEAAEAQPMLEEALRLAASAASSRGLDAVPRLVGDLGTVFYMVAKSPSRDLAGLAAIMAVLEEALRGEARIWMNGNNLAALPMYLDKGPAVRRFMESRLPEAREEFLALGLGDSLSDLGFLDECDLRLTPAGSQLAGLRLERCTVLDLETAGGGSAEEATRTIEVSALAAGGIAPAAMAAEGGAASSAEPKGHEAEMGAAALAEPKGHEAEMGSAAQAEPKGHEAERGPAASAEPKGHEAERGPE